MSVTFTDPRLASARPSACSDNPITDSLTILRAWKAAGVHLTRKHVEAAARITGANFGQLWGIILRPATIR
jgi:hypothetical protein